MNKVAAQIGYMEFLADFLDATGDYKNADICCKYLNKYANNYDYNIRIAGFNPLKTLGIWGPIDNVSNWAKEQGKKVDRWVRDNYPGGWTGVILTAIAIAGVPGVNMGPIFESANAAIAKGMTGIYELSMSTNPLEAAVGDAAYNTIKEQVLGVFSTNPGAVADIVGGGVGGYINTGGSVRGIFDPYSGQVMQYTSDKERKLQQIESQMFTYTENQKNAAQIAWKNVIDQQVPAYNKLYPAQTENQINKNDLVKIRDNVNTRLKLDLQGP